MSRLRDIFLLGCATSLLAGCATYRAEPIVPAQSAARFDARTLDDPRLAGFIAAARPDDQGSGWTLDRLTLAALYFHPNLDIAYARAEVAKAAIRTAAQRPNPSLNLSPQYNATTMIPSPWTVGAAINLLVETFGKRGDRTTEARDQADAARFDITTAVWQVRGGVRSALLDLWSADQHLDLARRRLEQQAQLFELLEHRLGAGEASGLDVAREAINRDQFTLAVRDAERAVATARTQVASAVGLPAHAFDGVTINLDSLGSDRLAGASPAIGDLRQAALTGRSDVQAALAQYEASQSALKLQVANQYPNLSFGPGYTYDQGDRKFSLPLTLDLPIFNQNQGPIAEATARRKQAAAGFLALQAQIIGAIDTTMASWQGATRSLATADALLAAARSRQARTIRLFQAGQIDRPTLLAGDLEVAAAELSRLDAAVAQRQALGQIEDAVQQPLFGTGAPFAIPSTSPRRVEETPQ
ncbi:TolC family protein [Sphingomonas sp. H39-1-10]|uniref:TolC family protein n=1 Tax=Sphingomonas pollutisoli TaxID=3030829 RepID=UPI0023B96347|nr:TolC family protein [Sphingomonas pollutisoli]MDF0491391.1 TolC family protein [Sphingomonas pollutisoli]